VGGFVWVVLGCGLGGFLGGGGLGVLGFGVWIWGGFLSARLPSVGLGGSGGFLHEEGALGGMAAAQGVCEDRCGADEREG